MYELTLQEFEEETITNLHKACASENIKIENIRYIYVTDDVVFDGKKAHTKYDRGFYITKNANVIDKFYDKLPDVYFAGHDIKNSIDIRSMEAACETGKEAALSCLGDLNIKNDIKIYKKVKVHNLYFTLLQSPLCILLFIIFLGIAIQLCFRKKKRYNIFYTCIGLIIIYYLTLCLKEFSTFIYASLKYINTFKTN